jgi:4-hydroxy-2-oxoheptanedioate aldolase
VGDDERVRAGAWSNLAGGTAELLSRSGAAFVVLDAQHGLYDAESLAVTLLQCGSQTAPVFVRVADQSPAGIGRALDLGASGVIVPLVDTVEQAAAAAASCRYPPEGNRSWGPMTGLVGRATPDPGQANAAVMCAVMVETAGGIDAVQAIAATPGVDMVFVGPFDLSLALGLDIDDMVDDTSPTSPLARIVRACAAAGIRAGVFAGAPERARRLTSFGFSDIVVFTDAALLADAAAAELQRWNGVEVGSPAADGT